MRRRVLTIFLGGILLAAWPGCAGKPADREGGTSKREEGWIPQIAPYLDCLPSSRDGQGSARLEPRGPVTAGSQADFKITFRVGEAGIAPGGFVLLQISPWWGWTPPQNQQAEGEGYIEVTSSLPHSSFQVVVLPLNRVLVFSRESSFPPGQEIEFDYHRARVDRFAEAEELFQIFVDADGDGHSACILDPPAIRVSAGNPSRLLVVSPSQVVPDKEIEIRATPLDEFGNWSRCPPGKYTLQTVRAGEELDGGSIRLLGGEEIATFRFVPPGEGIYFFRVEGPGGLEGTSNVTLCQKGEPGLKLYFGDIHGHSRLSDGTGTPEDFYRFAREVSGLDIAALTDHADYGTIPIEGKVWERIKRAANAAYAPGRFATFLGFEWTNWNYGHRNVYYRDGEGPIFRSIDPESDTPQKLWQLLAPYEAMTVAHHVGGGPVATDWRIAPGPQEWLVEICSVHGSSEYFGGGSCIYHPVEGAFVRDALMRGYRLGIIGSGDTHDGHPGQRSPGALVTGLMGVYAPELTREALWEAFRKRHVYGTSGPKIILNFRVTDAPMGSEVTWPASRGPVPVALRAIGCSGIETVEVVRNGETVFCQKGDGVFVQLMAEDPDPPPGTSWYYAKVLQKDGNMAWSSPIWLTVE